MPGLFNSNLRSMAGQRNENEHHATANIAGQDEEVNGVDGDEREQARATDGIRPLIRSGEPYNSADDDADERLHSYHSAPSQRPLLQFDWRRYVIAADRATNLLSIQIQAYNVWRHMIGERIHDIGQIQSIFQERQVDRMNQNEQRAFMLYETTRVCTNNFTSTEVQAYNLWRHMIGERIQDIGQIQHVFQERQVDQMSQNEQRAFMLYETIRICRLRTIGFADNQLSLTQDQAREPFQWLVPTHTHGGLPVDGPPGTNGHHAGAIAGNQVTPPGIPNLNRNRQETSAADVSGIGEREIGTTSRSSRRSHDNSPERLRFGDLPGDHGPSDQEH